jgi:hypothetical protein
MINIWQFILANLIISIVLTIVLIVVLLVIFRRNAGGLISDYVFDMLFSLADEAFGGLEGLDYGDWIAAVIVFFREKKVVGTLPALVGAWEVSGFVPIGMIPGVGTAIDLIADFTPTCTLIRVKFNKYGIAAKKEEKLRETIKVIEDNKLGIETKECKAKQKKAEEMIKKNNPVGAVQEIEKIEKEFYKSVKEFIANGLNNINRTFGSMRGNQELIEQITPVYNDIAEKVKELNDCIGKEDYAAALAIFAEISDEVNAGLNSIQNAA